MWEKSRLPGFCYFCGRKLTLGKAVNGETARFPRRIPFKRSASYTVSSK
jgi:hypothetical protein